tara:strand:- start:269 stop:433 length:165 start_codon:yes stop_codon:yes gene_type:complete
MTKLEELEANLACARKHWYVTEDQWDNGEDDDCWDVALKELDDHRKELANAEEV